MASLFACLIGRVFFTCYFGLLICLDLIPVAALSKACFCGHSLVGTGGSYIAGGRNVSCECCVVSGKGLCDRPIPRLEESYGVCLCLDCNRMQQ